MEFRTELVMLIKEFAMPVTRGDWREGAYINRQFDTGFKEALKCGIQLFFLELLSDTSSFDSQNTDVLTMSDDWLIFHSFSDEEDLLYYHYEFALY